MKQLIFLILCLSFFTAFVFAQTPPMIQTGFTVERELGETDKHLYEVNLIKGQMFNFVVEQRGIDIVLRIYTADGKFVDRVDSPNEREGDEPFTMVSLSGGRYRIEVSRLWEDSMRTTGKYFVKTVEIRKATEVEMKSARLKDELMKIVVDDQRFGAYPDALKRYFDNRALVTNSVGRTVGAAELIEITTKNPQKIPEGASSKDEFSASRLESFGDVVVLSVNRDRHFKNPKANIDQMLSQRSSYVFKRINGEWRIINVQRTLLARERQPVKLDTKQLDTLIGVYDGGGNPSETLTITREGDELFGNFPEQEKFRLISDTPNTFVGGFISIAFIRDASGKVMQAVVYYPMPDDRMTIQPKVK
jgi:hypothetical protein